MFVELWCAACEQIVPHILYIGCVHKRELKVASCNNAFIMAEVTLVGCCSHWDPISQWSGSQRGVDNTVGTIRTIYQTWVSIIFTSHARVPLQWRAKGREDVKLGLEHSWDLLSESCLVTADENTGILAKIILFKTFWTQMDQWRVLWSSEHTTG